jgi:hypothetical protein
MKAKYGIIVICLLCPLLGFAQSQLFDKYAEMDNVTSVYISKAMFNMIPAIGDVGLSLTNMKGKVESLQLVSTQSTDHASRMRKEFSQLVTKRHEELMRVRDGKQRITFYANQQGDIIKDLLMLADADSSFTAIQIIGNFTLQDVQEIAKNMDK